MYKICVYAIAKNESKNVEEWVESMRPADKIIVLDTGSTDDTVEKLRSFGVEVYEKHYEHFRFDTARNDCLDLVPDEYDILVSIDLDERFEQKNWADILRENWDPNKPRMIYDYIWLFAENGETSVTFAVNKIHEKNSNLRWIGAVHEHLWYLKENTREFTEDQVVDLRGKLQVNHYPDVDKKRFYLELLLERLEESKDDPITWASLGNEYRIRQEWENSIKSYQYCLDHFENQQEYIPFTCLHYWIGFCYFQLEDYLSAWEHFWKGLILCPIYRDNYYGLSILMFNCGLYDMAEGTIMQAFHITQRMNSWLEDGISWTSGLFNILGQVYFEKGQYDLAFQCAEEALKKEPSNPVLIEQYNLYKQCIN